MKRCVCVKCVERVCDNRLSVCVYQHCPEAIRWNGMAGRPGTDTAELLRNHTGHTQVGIHTLTHTRAAGYF